MPLTVQIDHSHEVQVTDRVDVSAPVCLSDDSSDADGTLTLKITHEGVVLDAVQTNSGEVVRTGFIVWDDLLDLTK